MPDLPGLDADVYFGDAEQDLPDWRSKLPEEASDDDELSPEEREAVIGLIGFDPGESKAEEPTLKQNGKIGPSPFAKS